MQKVCGLREKKNKIDFLQILSPVIYDF